MKLPLHDVHEKSKASWTSIAEVEVPRDYGDRAGELATILEGCGLIDLSWGSRLELRGADRLRFLNGQITCDVAGLGPGCNLYGFFTELKGRVLSDVYLMALEDRLWLELPPRRATFLREHLEKYIVADRVEIHSIDDLLPLCLAGPRAAGIVADHCDGTVPESGSNSRLDVGGTDLQISRRSLYGLDTFCMWTSSAVAEGVWNDLLALEGVCRVGTDALETARVRAGTARWGVDYDAGHLPHETGLLEEAVDFEKGCYLGQEIVARVHYRGQSSRVLAMVGVRGERPSTGADIVVDGDAVGRLTSLASAAEEGRWLGLAVVKRSALAEGAVARLSDGREVELAGSSEGPARPATR